MGEYSYRSFYIPERMMDGLVRFIQQGIEPGSFLLAVLSNDLVGACGQADEENLMNLPAYVAYLYNEVPSRCWGSPEKVQAWIKQRGRRQ